MDASAFDDKDISNDKLARMDPRQRRQYLESKVYREFKDLSPSKQSLEDSFFGASPPSIFVGRYGYPNVNAGILSPVAEQDTATYDAPDIWSSQKMPIEEVIGYRSNLVNSRDTVSVTETEQFMDVAKEIAMAKDPVDIEVDLTKTPDFDLNLGERTAPFGPAEQIEDVELAENPSIARAVEKAVGDDDWKAEDAAQYLYSKELDTYQIQRVLSAGLLGEQQNRRMVPTRWSITATDDILGKGLRREVKDNQELGDYHVYEATYNGNIFTVVFIPGQWEYELLEIKGSGSVWNPGTEPYYAVNHETYEGRSSYAKATAGAYYAARLAALEQLNRMNRQAKVLIVREVTDAYWAPLGVWVIRETVRDAFENEAEVETFDQAIDHVDTNTSISMDTVRDKSTMLEGMQRSVTSFF